MRSTPVLFICSKMSVFQCEKFGPCKVECRVHTERFFGRKENCYLQPWKWFLSEVARLMGHVHGALVETFNWVGLQSSTSGFQKCIRLYRLMLWHVRAVNLLVLHSQEVYKSLETLFVLIASVWNENTEFFKVRCWQIWNFKRIPVGDIQSFDIPRDVYPRLKKLPQKYYQVSSWRSRSIWRGNHVLSKWDQSSQECMLYLDLGYSNAFVILTVVCRCQ